MGSKSKTASHSQTVTNTTNLALDRSRTVGSGTQILDSIIVDPSDTVMVETIRQHRATFEVMMAENTFQLEALMDLGQSILTMANEQMIQLEGTAYTMLDGAMRMLKDAKEQGQFVIKFADAQAGRTFDLATNVATQQDNRLGQALDLVADVTADRDHDQFRTLAVSLTVFALGGLFLLTRALENN